MSTSSSPPSFLVVNPHLRMASNINNRQQVLGYVTNLISPVPLVIWEDGRLRDEAIFNAPNVIIDGIDNQGRVYGKAPVHVLNPAVPVGSKRQRHQFIFDTQTGRSYDRNTPEGRRAMKADGITAPAELVHRNQRYYARQASGLVELEQVGHSILPFGCRPDGMTLGLYYENNSSPAVLWQRDGRALIIGMPPGTTNYTLRGNNISELFIGAASGSIRDSAYEAWTWQAGVFTRLPPLRGRHANPSSINRHGQIVGSSSGAEADTYPTTPVMWHNGQVYDLNACIPADSGWILYCAHDINDDGWIVGEATYAGQVRGYVLRPVVSSSI